MHKQSKKWGETSLIFDNNNIHIYQAKINKDQLCSKHYHKYKHNLFFVQTGTLEVRVWHDDQMQTHILSSEDKLSIPPGLWHQFKAIDECIILEIYYTEILHNDIIRYI